MDNDFLEDAVDLAGITLTGSSADVDVGRPRALPRWAVWVILVIPVALVSLWVAFQVLTPSSTRSSASGTLSDGA